MEIIKPIYLVFLFIFVLGCKNDNTKGNEVVKKITPKIDTFHIDTFYYDANDTLAGKEYQPHK